MWRKIGHYCIVCDIYYNLKSQIYLKRNRKKMKKSNFESALLTRTEVGWLLGKVKVSRAIRDTESKVILEKKLRRLLN